MRLKFFSYWLQILFEFDQSMSKIPDPSDNGNRPPDTNPLLLTLLCAVLVGIATWTIFLVR